MKLAEVFWAVRRATRHYLAQRRDRRELAALLHRSTAWHCGCSRCTGRVLGIRYETTRLTEEQLEALRWKR